MITILTSDGRTLSYDAGESVLVIGNWATGTLTARSVPVLDVNPGNWLYLPFGKQAVTADRDYDLALVRNVAGKAGHFA
jgi:hypothetical protein